VSGQDVVRQIEDLPVDNKSRPMDEAAVKACGELVKAVKGEKSQKKLQTNILLMFCTSTAKKEKKKKKKSSAKASSDSESSDSSSDRKKKKKKKEKSKKAPKEKK
jgi:peptidyl-prolyl isomerase G (cyclophilin G)